LVVAARRGDRQALDALLRAHYDQVYAVCFRLVGNAPDAADATQDALIAIVRGLPRFDGRSRFSTWIYRIATNAALDEIRRRARRPLLGHSGADQPESGRVETAASQPSDERAVDDRLAVDAALQRLPVEFRAAVVLRDLLDLEYADISVILEVPPGTVRSRIARGRALLAEMLGPPGNPDPAARRPSERP
jgi:RNA polymerase sigma-70 factor, ECF subfamily